MVVEKMITDKNGRDIKVGDYVQMVNRITGSIEDSGYVSKIDGRHVYLGIVYENGKGVNTIYYPRDLIVKYKY
jgi:hypothetical protein